MEIGRSLFEPPTVVVESVDLDDAVGDTMSKAKLAVGTVVNVTRKAAAPGKPHQFKATVRSVPAADGTMYMVERERTKEEVRAHLSAYPPLESLETFFVEAYEEGLQLARALAITEHGMKLKDKAHELKPWLAAKQWSKKTTGGMREADGDEAESDSPLFLVGSKVKIDGTEDEALDGKIGTVTGYDATSSKYQVKLDGSNKVVSVAREHLTLLPRDDGDGNEGPDAPDGPARKKKRGAAEEEEKGLDEGEGGEEEEEEATQANADAVSELLDAALSLIDERDQRKGAEGEGGNGGGGGAEEEAQGEGKAMDVEGEGEGEGEGKDEGAAPTPTKISTTYKATWPDGKLVDMHKGVGLKAEFDNLAGDKFSKDRAMAIMQARKQADLHRFTPAEPIAAVAAEEETVAPPTAAIPLSQSNPSSGLSGLSAAPPPLAPSSPPARTPPPVLAGSGETDVNQIVQAGVDVAIVCDKGAGVWVGRVIGVRRRSGNNRSVNEPMLLWDMKKLNMMVVCEWYSLNRKTSKLKLDTAVVQDTQEYSAWACLGTVELRPSPKHPDYQFAEPAQLAKLDAAAELAEDATKPPPKKKAGKKVRTGMH
jgi:hypothetical protein